MDCDRVAGDRVAGDRVASVVTLLSWLSAHAHTVISVAPRMTKSETLVAHFPTQAIMQAAEGIHHLVE